MSDLRIAIIGAGVVGLNTALCLQEKFPKCRISILTDAAIEDTTSYGPAGIFRPGNSFSGPAVDITRTLIRDAFNFYKDLLGDSNSGVEEISGYLYSNTNEQNVRNHLMENLVPVYRKATEEEKSYDNCKWKYGSYIETLIIGCRRFQPWALDRFCTNGGSIIRQRVESFTELSDEYHVVFNCAGLGAKYLCDDYSMVPIRGQLIKVQAPWLNKFYYNDFDTYIIPVGDGIVGLGGTRNYDSYDTKVNKYDTSSIMERCQGVVPSLKKSIILKEWVGLRPHRDQVRLETEQIGKLTVIHNYGHGGYGITSAPGTAAYAVNLLREKQSKTCKL